MFGDGAFYTPDRRARFVAVEPPAPHPVVGGAFVLNTGRVRDHWHTMTRTGKAARLSAHMAEPFVEIHPADATALGIRRADLVRLFTFRQGNANLVELTLSADSPYVGTPAGLVPFPDNCALVTILRDGQVYTPEAEQPLESGDELLFVVPAEVESELEHLLSPGHHPG